MNFQKTVIIVAGIILVIALSAVAYFSYKAKSTAGYPPIIPECPDYWVSEEANGKNQCVNKNDMGSDSCAKVMDFSKSPWIGDSGLCRKLEWAKKCDLSWDGVTNNDRLKC